MSLHCSLFVLVSPVLQNAWVHPKCLWMIGYADVQQWWKGKYVIFKPGFHVYIFRSVNDHQQKFLNRPTRSPRLATATYSTGAAPSAKALTTLRKGFPRETFLSDDVTRSLALKACELSCCGKETVETRVRVGDRSSELNRQQDFMSKSHSWIFSWFREAKWGNNQKQTSCCLV